MTPNPLDARFDPRYAAAYRGPCIVCETERAVASWLCSVHIQEQREKARKVRAATGATVP